MFDEDRSDRIEAKELEYVLRLVFKERPNKQRVEECMKEFDVDGKLKCLLNRLEPSTVLSLHAPYQ